MILILNIILILSIIFISLFQSREHFENKEKIDKQSRLHKYFDKIYVITLEKRKKYVIDTLNKFKIKPIVFDAILKNKLNKEKLIKDNFIVENYIGGTGRIACHYSHLETLKKFLKSDSKRCFIFEDDILEPEMHLGDYNKIIDDVMKTVPKTYDIIYFGRCWDKCHKDIKISKHLVKSTSPRCRHAYAVTRNGAKIIIEKSLPMVKGGGDSIIANLITKGDLESYSVTPPLFKQNRKYLGSNLANNDTLDECVKVRKKKRKSNRYRIILNNYLNNNKITTKSESKSHDNYNNKSDNKYNKSDNKYNKSDNKYEHFTSAPQNKISNTFDFPSVKGNIILTTYFCNVKDVHGNKFSPCNDIRYIGNWYYSLKKLKLNGIVFHDHCTEEFINKYTTNHIKFVYVDSSKFTNTLNDYRFILYYKFLLNNPNLNKVFMTDGNDITIVKNPFNLVNDDNVYVGSEENIIEEKTEWFIKECMNSSLKDFIIKNKEKKILNAGIVGGNKKPVLKLLSKMNKLFNKFRDKSCNINMTVLNFVIYENNIKFKTNGGLNSRFKFYENYREDVCFIHK